MKEAWEWVRYYKGTIAYFAGVAFVCFCILMSAATS